MNNLSKNLTLSVFSFAIMLGVSSAQHHSLSSHHNTREKVQKTEELPSGLSQNNHGHSISQDSTKSGDTHMNMGNHNHMDMGSHGHMDMNKHDMNMDSADVRKNPLVREGVIDLNSIDENKDGKVYQDVMDWNVISDQPGKCPLCGMELKEVSLEKAKENLTTNDFKVKA